MYVQYIRIMESYSETELYYDMNKLPNHHARWKKREDMENTRCMTPFRWNVQKGKSREKDYGDCLDQELGIVLTVKGHKGLYWDDDENILKMT